MCPPDGRKILVSYGLPADLATPGEWPNTTKHASFVVFGWGLATKDQPEKLGLGHLSEP